MIIKYSFTSRCKNGKGRGIFSYGQVTSNHLECVCCLDAEKALTEYNNHSAFTTYQLTKKAVKPPRLLKADYSAN